MSMPQRIEVTSGAAPWLRASRQLTFLSAGLGLAVSPVAWSWMSGALLVLLASWTWTERRRAGRQGGLRPMVLHLDGRLSLRDNGRETHGVARPAAWISRWFCVLRWTENDRGRTCSSLVCASENHPDDYRRLLTWLRLDVFREGEGVT